MFNAKIGDNLLRITPPAGPDRAYCQLGLVSEVNDTEILVGIQADLVRYGRFSRVNGMATSGDGSFLVRPGDLPPTGN